VVDGDPLAQQLLDIAIRDSVPEIPADRQRDHLWREPEPGKCRPVNARTGGSRSTHPPSFLSPPDSHRPGSTNGTDPEYVDWYNNHRLHSLLNNLTPEEYEQAYSASPTGPPPGDAANEKTA
jgi:transposase InsO family protein